MKTFDATTVEQGAAQLLKMRQYRPYEYGGKWFLVQKESETVAVRTKRAAVNQAQSQYPIFSIN